MNDLEEIESHYKTGWVLIGDYELDEMTRLRRGRVLFHGLDRDAVYRKAKELSASRIAVRYMGSIPEDLVLIL